jgi:hypothetical protein
MVENGAESIDVGPRTHLSISASSLFWRHIPRASEYSSGDCQASLKFHTLGQAEVRNPRLISPINQDILRFEIAMNDASLVSIVDSTGNLLNVHRRILSRERRVANNLLQISPLHIVHGEVMLTLAFPDLVDGHDVGMLELSRRFRLSTKAFDVRV